MSIRTVARLLSLPKHRALAAYLGRPFDKLRVRPILIPSGPFPHSGRFLSLSKDDPESPRKNGTPFPIDSVKVVESSVKMVGRGQFFSVILQHLKKMILQ